MSGFLFCEVHGCFDEVVVVWKGRERKGRRGNGRNRRRWRRRRGKEKEKEKEEGAEWGGYR